MHAVMPLAYKNGDYETVGEYTLVHIRYMQNDVCKKIKTE